MQLQRRTQGGLIRRFCVCVCTLQGNPASISGEEMDNTPRNQVRDATEGEQHIIATWQVTRSFVGIEQVTHENRKHHTADGAGSAANADD